MSEIDALKAKLAELEAENGKLRERCKPSKVVLIGDRGHYVSEAVAARIAELEAALSDPSGE